VREARGQEGKAGEYVCVCVCVSEWDRNQGEKNTKNKIKRKEAGLLIRGGG
jgi:hypothetical protein